MEIVAKIQSDGKFQHVFCALGHGGLASRQIESMGGWVVCLEQSVEIFRVRTLLRLYRFLTSSQFSIIHTHGVEANFYGLLAGAAARIPVRIAEEAGLPRHGRKARFVMRRVFRLASCVVTMSQSIAETLVSLAEVTSQELRVIYPPVEMPQESRIHQLRGHGPYRLCYVGRLHPIKNLPFILLALSRAVNSGLALELVIVGDGPEYSSLQALVSRLKLQGFVSFVGAQSEPRDIVAESDVGVLVSSSEGLGIALIEAMSLGLPVVATNVGGAVEFVEDGRNGWLVSPTCPSQIFEVLQTISSVGRPVLREMGDRAREAVERKFGARQYLQELDNLYTEFSAGLSGG